MVKKRNKWWKRIVYISLGVVLLGAFAWSMRPKSLVVEAGQVARGPLRVTIDGEGKTRVRDRFVVSAPLGGVLQRITLRPGDPVAEGAPVARIKSVEPALLDVRARAQASSQVKAAQAALERATSAIQSAEVAVESAANDAERERILVAKGAGARARLDAAELLLKARNRELDASKFARETARFQLETERAMLGEGGGGGGSREVAVHAPIAGVVLRVLKESSEVVPAGTPLLEIGNLSTLEVVVDLVTTQAVEVRPGVPVVLAHWGGSAPLEGRVQRIEPSAFTKISALGVEEQRVNVVIELAAAKAPGAAPDPAPLGDGYRLEAHIVVWESKDVLSVPLGALFRQGDEWAVFAIEAGRARRHLIKLGHRGERAAEVLGGLSAGQQVVLHPGDKLEEGQRVETSS